MATATKAKGKKGAAKSKMAEQSTRVGPEHPDFIELVEKHEGKTTQEVADLLGVQYNKVLHARAAMEVKPKERIKGSEAEVAAGVKELRKEGKSWLFIAVRSGLSIAQIKEVCGGNGRVSKATEKAVAKSAKSGKGSKVKTKSKDGKRRGNHSSAD